ncbi:MAG: type II toxin-antitoxin system HipA family toxin, partial [Actinobacteria bacterium]|nr:type II toxin-antitoxin system HipA family toxin [Actinomycetota bacterium]
QVGVLSRPRGVFGFQYTDDAVAGGAGRPLLSVSMPVSSRLVRGTLPLVFFDGLLPEGEIRRMIAYDFGLDATDLFGLLRELGRDFAGALILLPEGEHPAPEGQPEAISGDDVARRLRDLRFHPLGVDRRVRASLAGMQEKLLLARSEEGWGLPVDGVPSTHILKPAHPLLPLSIANEALCLRAARHLGMRVANVEIAEFSGASALVIERYDRVRTLDKVVRLHQEDFCQALGVPSEAKYEERGGPSLRNCAELLRRWARSDQLEHLLDGLLLNVVVGNADAHAKNFSLVHGDDGQIALAPLYGVMTTVHYPGVDPVAGMYVNGIREIAQIGARDVVAEAVGWGLRRPIAEARVYRRLQELEPAILQAADELGSPGELVQTLIGRSQALARS